MNTNPYPKVNHRVHLCSRTGIRTAAMAFIAGFTIAFGGGWLLVSHIGQAGYVITTVALAAVTAAVALRAARKGDV